MSGEEYNTDSVYQLCLKNADQAAINVFEDSGFAEFCGVLDGKLKQLGNKWKRKKLMPR